jgi:hypothetical protein
MRINRGRGFGLKSSSLFFLMVICVLCLLAGCSSGGGSSEGSTGGDDIIRQPVASIESISPNPADFKESITFSAKASTFEGTEATYEWVSDISGHLSDQPQFSRSDLPVGMHVITLVVRDSNGGKSESARAELEVRKVIKAPTAVIGSIQPNPAMQGQKVTFSGSGTDPDGTVVAYQWASDIQGVLSTKAQFSTTELAPGGHTITFIVTDNDGVQSDVAETRLEVIERVVEYEDIYVALIYSWEHVRWRFVRVLERLKARDFGTHFEYDRGDKIFRVHFVRDKQSYEQALRTEGAHIILTGHSVYGIGQIFPMSRDEIDEQVVNDFMYMDDDRLSKTSSRWVSVNIHNMITKEALPEFWPVFKNGDNAVAPYDFYDQRDDPPYNYYHTYQVPGDPTVYRVESARNGALQRFPGSKTPPWYSASGAKPDPYNPEHKKYYILNENPKEVKIDGVTYPAYHYSKETILLRGEPEVPQEEFKYQRLVMDMCYSGTYYLGTFNRGIVFYSVALAGGRAALIYLQEYLQGSSDEVIWAAMQEFDPVYDYFDFTRKPSEQERGAQEAAATTAGSEQPG